MAIEAIRELRILPPLAIGRFGSSPEPLGNFSLQIDDPLGFRKIVPAPTLILDDATGEITGESTGATVRFRDDQGRVKPLAPFLEVWARFKDNGPFEPLTKQHLQDLNLQPSDIVWSVSVANIKAFRRTGDPNDKVRAQAQISLDANDPGALHRASSLIGISRNFKPGKAIAFGTVRYVRPNDQFPEIRFRFTPAAGLVYGTRAGDPLIADDVYAGVTGIPAPPNGPWSAPFAGAWDRYWIGAPNSPPVTAPGDIFQGQQVAGTKVSDGYLDDTCDGVVTVQLTVGTVTLSAYARIMSGVPDFAPDSYHVRTILDDLEQMALGPDVTPPQNAQEESQLKDDVVDTLRRSYETVRLMNTMVQNGDQNVGGVAVNGNNMPGQQTGYGRRFEPIYPTVNGSAAYQHALEVHRAALQKALNSPTLAGSFTRLGLVRPYLEAGDLRSPRRRRMPAMMRGSDGLEMALTRRQRAKLALAANVPAPLVGALAAVLATDNFEDTPQPAKFVAKRTVPRTKSVK